MALRFSKGDRDTGYGLRRLISLGFLERWRWDLVLAKYPPHSYQPYHQDEVDGWAVYRISVIIRAAEKGGRLLGGGVKSFLGGWINYMRADKTLHTVTPVEGKKTRYALIISLFVRENF